MPRYRQILLAVIVVVLIVWAGFLGYYLGIKNPDIIIVKGIDNLDGGVVINANMGVFWQTWRVIKDNYLKATEVKDQDLIYGGAAGLVNALKDPHSSFFNPPDSKKLAEDLGGSFGGIGAEIGIKNEQLIIVAPLKDTPAEKAGLIAGDRILEINASSTIGISVMDAVKMIRGPEGTDVNLSIGRKEEDKPRKMSITRAVINIPVIEWKMKDNNLAHLQLFTFTENSSQLVQKALSEIKEAGAQGIVLDLRNNPGGFLDSAIEIAGLFIERGQEVVSEEFRSGKKNVFLSENNPIAKDIPLVIIINSGSASASEILAGAIRDHRGIKMVGEKSFGKGTVQELIELSDGSTVKITIAHWILPKGQQIDKNGIEPDFKVEISDKEREEKKDPQLDKALEILLEILNPKIQNPKP